MINRSSIGEVSISEEAHIESVEYMSDFHNYKLKIKYFENGELKKVVVGMNDRDTIIRNYFRDNGTNINNFIFPFVINAYKFIFLTLFIVLLIKVFIVKNNRDSK